MLTSVESNSHTGDVALIVYDETFSDSLTTLSHP